MPAEEGLVDAAALEAPPPAASQLPEDPSVLGEAERELLEAFPEEAVPPEEDEDVFGYGDDLGESAYLPGTAVPDKEDEAGDRGEPPQPKRARITAATLSVGMVTASLEGLEARLKALGEVPRFVPSQPGLLRHTCCTVNASVC